MDLSGTWRAAVADDELRRAGIGLDADDDHWEPIQVPGHWRHHPAFADSDGPILYRTRFELDAPRAAERHFVVLDGIFYQGDVWLDGAYLGDPEGYFSPHAFDVTALAALGTEHVLAVEVTCNPQGNKRAKRNVTGVFQDWPHGDPDWNPGGLWRPVRIETTGAVRVDRLRVLCREANETNAHVRLHARLDSDGPQSVLLRTIVDGTPVAEQEQSLARGLNEVDWNVDIGEPRLWWPWSLGEQALTEISVEVFVVGDRGGGEPSDRRSVRTGLREVALQDWAFVVNGERLYAKGANLAPTRLAIADASPAEVRRDVELAREAGLDLLRVHGHIGRHELYDAADELGVLLWQDFPLHAGYARSIRRQAVQQARDAVDLLGHHPSVAAWCAHNEPVAAATPVRRVLGQQLPTWNKTILDRWVKRAIERADETRTTVAHSGVLPHLPQLDGTDSHLWFGWRSGDERDLAGLAATVPRLVRFVSEFGAQSVPDSAHFVHAGSWPDLDWELLAERYGYEAAAFETHVPPAAHATFASWRTATQRYQAELLRHHIETLRRLKYRPSGGFCFFALNDPVPAISFSVLDHERAPKLAFHAVAEACRPVIVVSDRAPAVVRPGQSLALDVHVVSDLRHDLVGATVTATLRWSVDGSHAWSFGGDVAADSCVRVGTIQFVVPDAPGDLWLDLTFEAADHVVTNRSTATIARPG